MWDKRYFGVGDWIQFWYNGKLRMNCEVIAVRETVVTCNTEDGPKSFSYHKMSAVEHVSLA